MKTRDLGEKGVALALVLWLVVLLGAVAAAVGTSTRATSGVVLNARARTVARYAAESGIVAGTALLNHKLTTGSPAQQAVAFRAATRELASLNEVPLGAGRFSVEVTNLNGRLDLNYADPEALVGLFSQFTSPAAARAVVEVLKDWRDADQLVRPQGAEEQTYGRAGSLFVPRNAPLTRFDELRGLLGMTEPLARALEPYVTVNGDGHVDVNAAPEAVLIALPGIGVPGARTIISGRSGGPLSSAAEVQALLGVAAARSFPRLAVAPSRLLLTSRGWLTGHPLTHEIQATYAILGQRLVLQSWRERDL
jgi:general secretion pathway protein K